MVFTPPEVIIASSIGRKPLISTVKAFKSSQRVLRSSLVTEFKKKFKEIGFVDDDFETIGRNDGQHEITILPDAYASSQDLANAAAIKANSDADADLKSKVKENRSAIKKAHAAEGADPSEAQGLEDIE